MRIAFVILIGIHGIIHLFGFLKAFGIIEFNAISLPISKTHGLLWLFTFLLFAITIGLNFNLPDHWWVSGLLAVAMSQTLIFIYWSDAKLGTIANLIVLIAITIGYAKLRFEQKIRQERKTMFESSQVSNTPDIVSEASLDSLPPIIQKWLSNSGVVGKQNIYNVYLSQQLQLKLTPEQKNWNEGTAEQYFTVQPPAFNWSVNTEMNPLLRVVGRDKFADGKGEMIIRLLSLIPVAHAKDDEKIDEATLQRYLAEIVWFPSASLNQYIRWKDIDDRTAMATMNYKGTTGSGEFHFDNSGNFRKFRAMRYQNSEAINPTEWTVTAIKIEERSGIKIPIECEASWELESGKWTWLRLRVTAIDYNIDEMPVANHR